MTPEVLFHDPSLCVLIKPVGMPSQPDPSGTESLLDWVARRLPGPTPHPVHRLDQPAGGLLAVARGPRAAAVLFEQFRTRTVDRTYLALVEQPDLILEEEACLTHHLVKRGRTNLSQAFEEPVPGSRPARLGYRLLHRGKTRALLEVRLETGRHHQVRAQLARIGCPLAGDKKYGARRQLREGGIALFGYRLGMTHPLTGQPLRFQALPAGPCWQPFLEAWGPSPLG